MTCFSYCLLPDTKSAVQSLDSVSKNLHIRNDDKTRGCKRSRISVKCFLKTCKSHFYRSLRYVLNFFFYKLFWSLHCLISFNVCYLSKKKKIKLLEAYLRIFPQGTGGKIPGNRISEEFTQYISVIM